jgi:hypothetical protein
MPDMVNDHPWIKVENLGESKKFQKNFKKSKKVESQKLE